MAPPTQTADAGSANGAGHTAAGESYVCSGQFFKGVITGNGSLVVDGEVTGNIHMPEGRVTVGLKGHVSEGLSVCITAREIIVIGKVEGNVSASDRVEIHATGRLIGNISTGRISIAEGAYFKGDIDLGKTDPKPASSFSPRASGRTYN